MTTTARRNGDKVSIDRPEYPGIWTIESQGPVNAVLRPESGGRGLRAPKAWLIDPTTERAVEAPTMYFEPGELVKIASGKYAGVWVVIADRRTDKVNLAKLGGDHGRYLRATRRGLAKVNVEDVNALVSML
jgi:hypothetical protein